MKYRIRFSKTGRMRYVGHLDLMRFFQKALRRAGIPLAFSQGYHPHPLISFAAPLSVGVTSCGEYMDIVTEEAIDIAEAIPALNAQMAEGMAVLSITKSPEKVKSAMAAVEAASYFVYFKTMKEGVSHSLEEWRTLIDRFYSDAETILVMKKTKNGEREVDLKPLIYDFRVVEVKDVMPREAGEPLISAENQRAKADVAFGGAMLPISAEDSAQFCLAPEDPVFYMETSCGSTDNIKPELVMEHFLSADGLSIEDFSIGVHRIAMEKKEEDGRFVPLGY